MGTKCDRDHLSMETNCLGDLLSSGTKLTGTIGPLGPIGSGDQVSWGLNVSQPHDSISIKLWNIGTIFSDLTGI